MFALPSRPGAMVEVETEGSPGGASMAENAADGFEIVAFPSTSIIFDADGRRYYARTFQCFGVSSGRSFLARHLSSRRVEPFG